MTMKLEIIEMSYSKANYDYMIEIITALKEGKQIQYSQFYEVWLEFNNNELPNFTQFVYRIKPEQKKYRVGLIDPKTAPVFPLIIKDEQSAIRLELASGFVGWSTDWIEY